MTARMGMRFRRPVPLGRRLRVEARVTRVRKRFLEAKAEVRLDGEVLAEGEGVFLRVTGEQARELEALYSSNRATPDEMFRGDTGQGTGGT